MTGEAEGREGLSHPAPPDGRYFVAFIVTRTSEAVSVVPVL